MAQVVLTWRDRSSNEAGFTVERCQGGACTNFQVIATLPANTTTYTDTNLPQLTTFRYRVSAFNRKGKSGYSNTVTITTASDTPPITPPAPTLSLVVPGDAKNTLTYTASTSGATYNVKRSTSSAGAYITVATGLTGLTYVDQPLTNGQAYYYVVSATLNGVESANSNQLTGTPTAPTPPPQPPTAPTGLNSVAGDAQVTLNWGLVASAVSYNVKRSTVSGGPYTTIKTGIASTNYADLNLTNGTKYYYVVSATNAYGTSGNSNETNATPQSANPNPPPGPDPAPGTGTIINVPAGFDLQAAINAANPGDIVSIQANATFIGNYTVVKNNIIIRTSNLTGLGNSRIVPGTVAAAMPKIRGIGQGAAFVASAGLTGLSLIGLDITIAANTYTPDIVDIQSLCSNVTIDKCFIHPKEITASQLSTTVLYRTSGRGIHANGTNIIIKNSYIAGFAGYELNTTSTAIDSEGIYSDFGPGPVYIQNNYIESNFNCVLIGGSNLYTTRTATLTGATTTSATFSNTTGISVGTLIALFYTTPFTTLGGKQGCHWGTVKVSAVNTTTGLVNYAGYGPSGNLPGNPDSGSTSQARWGGSNILFQVTGNTLAKRQEWLTQGLGAQWKAFVEVKSAATGSLIDANICTGSGYHGNAFGITPRSQNGADPWASVSGLTISNNNLYTTIGAPLICQLEDNEATTTPGSIVQFSNNLVPITTNDNYNYLLQLSGGGRVTINHNTFVNFGVSNVAVSSQAMSNPSVNFTNNIVDVGLYGWSCFVAPGSFVTCWPGWTENKNLVVTDGGATNIYPNSIAVANYAAVKFVNQSAGDFHLASDSPGKAAASDGKDIGCDLTLVPGAITAIPTPPVTAYYVATTGDNNNAGTITAPFRDVSYGVSRLNVLNVPNLIVRGGDYDDAIDARLGTVPSGTSWTNKISISAYPGETVWLKPTNNRACFLLGGDTINPIANASYIELDGINMDSRLNTDPNAIVGFYDTRGGSTISHIRVKNCEIVGPDGTIGTSGLFVMGFSFNCEMINMICHGNAYGYAFYVSGQYNIIDGCDIYNTDLAGIQVYQSVFNNNFPIGNIIRNCKIHDIHQAYFFGNPDPRIYGILIDADDTQIYGNSIYNVSHMDGLYQPGRAGIFVFHGNNTRMWNNTITKNLLDSIDLNNDGTVTNTVIQNNIAYGNSNNNLGGTNAPGTVSTPNLIGVNPTFVNSGTNDFHLTSGSAARGVGVNLFSIFTTDQDGIAWPSSGPYDDGCFRFVSSAVDYGQYRPQMYPLFGTDTRGAWGGATPPVVYRVTNLNDSGLGSLRAALEGVLPPRVVIFEISGTCFSTTQDIVVSSPYVTCAFQTAPSPGFTLAGFGIQVFTHDVVMQHARVRPGDGPPLLPQTADHDAMIMYAGTGIDPDGVFNIIFDHCSMSWAQGKNTEPVNISPNGKATYWRCINSEALYHAKNVIVSAGQPSSLGMLIAQSIGNGPTYISVMQNLFALNSDRNPEMQGNVHVLFSNNVVYGWGYDTTDYQWATFLYNAGNDPTLASVIGNVYIAGPPPSPFPLIAIGTWNADPATQLYISDNAIDQTKQPIIAFQNSSGGDPRVGTSPIDLTGIPIMASSATKAFVLANAGARPLNRDAVDTRIVSAVTNRTGSMISSQDQVGGWPSLAVNTRTLTIPSNPNAVASGQTFRTNMEMWLEGYAAALEP